MAKSVKVSKSTQDGTKLDDLVKEGKALGKMWSALHNVRQSTKANGFDTRLGKLLVELKAQSTLDSGQISRQTLTTHGVHNIDRRRRSEALWFVENEVACRAFMDCSKKGFTSLTALQKAMKDAAKADDGIQAMKDAGNAKASAEAEEVSNVGQSEEKPKAKKKLTASDVAFETVLALDTNGISKEEFLVALKEQLELIEDNTKLDEVA